MRTRHLLLIAAIGLATSVALVAQDNYLPADGVFPVPGRISSWSGFVKQNAMRRAAFAESQARDQGRIVFVGDSITEGWHMLDVDFLGIGVRVANRGIGGDTTPNLVYRLQDDVLSLQPRGLVLLIGTNDLGERTAPEQIAANLSEVLARIRAAYPAIPVAWCLVMPRGRDGTYVDRIRELNSRIRALAASDPLITLCDTFTPLAQDDGTARPEYFQPDLLHLNSEGYAAWRRALFPIVAGWNKPAG